MKTDTSTTSEDFSIGSLGRHSVIYGLGMVLTKAVSFIMLPVYTRLLSPSDYGVLMLIAMTFEVVTIVAGSRIAWGIFHYYHKEEDEAGRNAVLSTALLLLAATFFVTAAIAISFAPAIAGFVFGSPGEFANYVRIAGASMAFEGLILVPLALFQLRNQSKKFVLVGMVKLGMQLVLNLIFLIPLGMGVQGVLLSSLITNVVVGSYLAISMVAGVGLIFRTDAARNFLRFGVPLMAMQVATFVVTYGDRYFLNKASGTAEVGLYGLAYQFGFLVATLGFAPFQRVWDPQRFGVAKRPDRDKIFAEVFVYLNVLLISVALGIAVFAHDLLRIIAAEQFHGAAAFVPILAAAYVFHAWANFLNLGIFLAERTEFFTIANWIAAAVALTGYVWLIPVWGAWGATVTTFASLGVRCLLAHVFSQRLWRVAYDWKPVLIMVALALGLGGLSVIIPPLGLAPSLGVNAAIYLAYTVLLWHLPVLSGDQKAAITRRLVQLRSNRPGLHSGGRP